MRSGLCGFQGWGSSVAWFSSPLWNGFLDGNSLGFWPITPFPCPQIQPLKVGVVCPSPLRFFGCRGHNGPYAIGYGKPWMAMLGNPWVDDQEAVESRRIPKCCQCRYSYIREMDSLFLFHYFSVAFETMQFWTHEKCTEETATNQIPCNWLKKGTVKPCHFHDSAEKFHSMEVAHHTGPRLF